MKTSKVNRRSLSLGAALLLLFVIFTILVTKVDVAPIGVDGTDVGFSGINKKINDFFGENKGIYQVSEALGYLTWGVVAFFGLFGLSQLVKRRSLLKVDRDIILLGCGYAVMLAFYVLFEKVIINYRPATAGGELEASYPSSHTLMLVFVMATAIMQAFRRVKHDSLRMTLCMPAFFIAVAVTAGRLVGGVHWFTDIIGGLLLAAALATLYHGVAFAEKETKED
ncbi:MAG: phosphatase PAP2 family protein [Lachnospiraceae bacterium]|nr:phosphatase PAP2 family protein [Lachnospiraceae bacterium]